VVLFNSDAIDVYSEAINPINGKGDPKDDPFAFFDQFTSVRVDKRLYSNRAICYFRLKNYHKSIEDCNQSLLLGENTKARWIRRYHFLIKANHIYI
jgi:tetratricopeptide (TPR) repeat protein